MERDRYYQISKNISWSSNSMNKEIKEEKYKDFLFDIISNSNKLYAYSNQKTINESMVKFGGKAKNVIYIRDRAIYLYKNGIRATLTILAKRKNIPKNIINNLNLKLHEKILYKYEDIIHLIFWKDKKIIYTISNYYNGQIINALRLNKKSMKKKI